MTEKLKPPSLLSKLSFEASYKKLEEILEKLNSGDTPLDDAIKLYEEADQLIKVCNERLSAAEQKIEKLVKDREGNLTREPFE